MTGLSTKPRQSGAASRQQYFFLLFSSPIYLLVDIFIFFSCTVFGINRFFKVSLSCGLIHAVDASADFARDVCPAISDFSLGLATPLGLAVKTLPLIKKLGGVESGEREVHSTEPPVGKISRSSQF